MIVIAVDDAAVARFWSHVGDDRRPEVCWPWLACTCRGYGHFGAFGRQVQAHRLSYELTRGEIPAGLTLDHLCRNRSCVNPAHLEPVSRGENVLRGAGITARNSAKTHCDAGHELSDDNVYFYRGHRHCRACRLINDRIRQGYGTGLPPNYARTHCPQGHEYAGANLYIAPDGRRSCRICERAKFKRWYERKKAMRAA